MRHIGGILTQPRYDAALGRVTGQYCGFFVGVAPSPEAAAAGLRMLTADPGAPALVYGTRLMNFSDAPMDAATMFEPATLTRLRGIRAAVDPDRRLVANHPL